MVRKILPVLLVLIGLSLTGCGEYGKVEQGRTVAYDKTTTPPTVWIIQDSGIDDKHPQYTVLPAHPFQIPDDPNEMGAEPFVGKRLKLDMEKNEIVMYNVDSKQFDHLPFQLIEKHENVNVRRQHPLVYDSTTRQARKFPVVNEAEKTLTIYSVRQELLTTVKMDPDDFAKYGGDEWDAGDEVRIYYKEGPKDGKPGKSLRFMNVTKTDFTRRK
jgi:hypothetical protein